jgi:hypothetical protein
VKKKIRRYDRIYSSEEQVALIKDSTKTGKFTVHKVDRKNVTDFKNGGPNTKKQVLPTRCYG